MSKDQQPLVLEIQVFSLWGLLIIALLQSLVAFVIKKKSAAQATICFALSLLLPPVGWLYFGYLLFEKPKQVS
ncbi:MAG: hypothetical protein ACK4GU_16490 [Alishewanella aestuarii]